MKEAAEKPFATQAAPAQRKAAPETGSAARQAGWADAGPPLRSVAALSFRMDTGGAMQRLAELQPAAATASGGPARAASGGLPEALRSGIECLSGFSMEGVRVHRNSARPAQVGALAFAQGRDIHLGPGQDRHLPHEAWHVVQQAQGRVRATGRAGSVPLNDDAALEREADRMGSQARLALPEGAAPPTQEIPDAEASQAAIQRVRIHQTLDTHLGGAAPDKAGIRSFKHQYEIARMARLVDEYAPHGQARTKALDAYRIFQNRYAAAASSNHTTAAQWRTIYHILNNVVARINTALQGVAAPTGYEANRDENWGGVDTAVRAVHSKIDATAPINVQRPHRPGIRTIPFSVVRETFPETLWRLIRDIYANWQNGTVMDERTPAEQGLVVGVDRSLTSNTPGALRSWHLNTRGSLPAPAMATPANALALEVHYTATSGTMNALGAGGAAAPVGFAEYTGTGIRNDAHNSKIVLDYRRGDIYITLTHYQYWQMAGGQANLQGQDDGQRNPWYRIDMTR